MAKGKSTNRIGVLITTDSTKRGVFFGFVDAEALGSDSTEVTAEQVQMCVYWSAGVRGVLGLAANGPDQKSRVTAPVPKALIKGVTLICECSPEAVAAWKAQPWS